MKYFLFILLFVLQICNPLFAQTLPKGKGQAQSTYNTIERLETPNSGITVTGDKAVLFESDPDNLLVNPGFEHQTFGTGWTVNAGTATVDTTNFYDGKKSMSIALTAVTGDILTQCVTPTGQKGGTNLAHSLRVKTTLSNLQVCSVIGTSEQQCLSASNTDAWIEIVPTSVAITGSALCVKLKSTSSATGTVKVDSGYVGRNKNIGTSSTARKVVQIEWSGSQAANHDTDTKVTYSGASVSKLENFTFSSGTLTATVAGDYLCRANVRQTTVVDASLMRQSITKFYKNGSLYAREGYIPGLAGNNINSGGTGGGLPDANAIYGIPMSIGDTLEVYYYQSNGSGLNRSIDTSTVDCFYFPNSVQQSVSAATVKLPTVTRITSGSGTYTTPSGATSLRVKMTGGGGGANGNNGTSCSSGSNGTSTTFGGATAILGQTGSVQGACIGQSLASNSFSFTNGTIIVNSDSVCGQGGSTAGSASQAAGGQGGSNYIAIGGVGSSRELLGTAGRFGGGGGGTGSFANSTFQGCSGGNSGGYLEFIVSNPAASYSYSVGTGGAGGSGSRQNGVAGGDGIILIEEYYGYNAPIIVGSVTSRASTANQICAAKTTAAGSIASPNDGCIIANPSKATGLYTYTFSTPFSATPWYCGCSAAGAVNVQCNVDSIGLNSARAVVGLAGSSTDLDHTFFCYGPR